MTNFRSMAKGINDPPGRAAEVLRENAAASAAGKCPRCGETPGQGLACVECAQVRIARNQPRPSATRVFMVPVGTSPQEAARLRKTADVNLLQQTPVKAEEPAAKEKPDMPRTKFNRAIPPLIRGEGGATAAGGKFPCRNPAGNPKCSGTCGKEGGLCRSCGIRQDKGSDGPRAASRGPRAASDEPRAWWCPGCMRRKVAAKGLFCPECLAKAPTREQMLAVSRQVAAKGLFCPECLAKAPTREQMLAVSRPMGIVAGLNPESRIPAPAVPASQGPGPLTMALVDFFAECGKASRRVEASMVLEGREMTVQVKFALP